MGSQYLILLCILCFISSFDLLLAQQPYIGLATTACASTDNSTSVFGYVCNGQNRSCKSYLIFRPIPPYDSVSLISALLNSDPTELSQANSVSVTATFQRNQEVIVPVRCSCSGEYYQANSSYVVRNGDTYFTIANYTYQGLSTCQAMLNQNRFASNGLVSGMSVTVPLRCACPTRSQSSDGVNYLLSYLIRSGDTVYAISQQFGVNMQDTLNANQLSEENPNIYPFTTLLVPLQNQPTVNQTRSPPPPPSPLTPSTPSDHDNMSFSTRIRVIIGVAVGTFVLVAFLVLLYVFCRKKKKKKSNETIKSKEFEESEIPISSEKQCKSEVTEELLTSISDIGHSLQVYKFEDLQSATKNFSSQSNIKGSVYRGVINGDLAAIKVISGDIAKEIDFLKRINHFNLIRLSGVSFREGQWYLVYEYAENGPLSDWIFGGSSSKVLSWIQRVQITYDVANGLNYIHSYTEPSYVHKNIKSSSILLDGDFRAKIANLGMARSAEKQEGGFALTRHIVGTKGYMAPEYLQNGFISPKLDVYAFGVVMLETITGKQATMLWGEREMLLPEALTAMLVEDNVKDKILNFIDPALEGNYPSDLTLIMAKLIERCLKKDPSARPSMDEIVQSLSRILATSMAWALPSSSSASGSYSYDSELQSSARV